MKTFADYLPTMTAREREIVESFAESYGAYCAVCKAQFQGFSKLQDPLSMLQSTPPAKEPVSVEGAIWIGAFGFTNVDFHSETEMFNTGDRVRVVKIEEMT